MTVGFFASSCISFHKFKNVIQRRAASGSPGCQTSMMKGERGRTENLPWGAWDRVTKRPAPDSCGGSPLPRLPLIAALDLPYPAHTPHLLYERCVPGGGLSSTVEFHPCDNTTWSGGDRLPVAAKGARGVMRARSFPKGSLSSCHVPGTVPSTQGTKLLVLKPGFEAGQCLGVSRHSR